MTPSAERACWNCGAVFKSDMSWKIPLIILIVLLSFVFSAALALLN